MHPFAIAPGLYKACTFQIGKVTRDLGIVGPKRLGKKAHTYLTVAHQIKQPQPRPVCQRRE